MTLGGVRPPIGGAPLGRAGRVLRAYPTQDSMINSGAPTTNYFNGAGPLVGETWPSAGGFSRAFVCEYDIPRDAQRAILNQRIAQRNDNIGGYFIVRRYLQPLDFRAVTWNTLGSTIGTHISTAFTQSLNLTGAALGVAVLLDVTTFMEDARRAGLAKLQLVVYGLGNNGNTVAFSGRGDDVKPFIAYTIADGR